MDLDAIDKSCNNCGHNHINDESDRDLACGWCEDNKEWIPRQKIDMMKMMEDIKKRQEEWVKKNGLR